MLIPPSVLMVIWGIITGDSIGALFMAGILPGLLLASLYIAYILIAVKLRPDLAPERPVEKKMKGHVGLGEQNHSRRSEVLSIGGMGLLITLVLGGIWGGFFTPTEAAAVGGIGALVLAVAKGVRPRQIFQTFGETARITSAIMFLLVAAQMYSRMLSMSGVADFVERSVTTLGLTPAGLLLFITLVWLVLGCFIDSASILMLTLPIFWPLNNHLIKMPPLAFGLFGILVVEAGLLTPPFGLVLFTMKASVPGVSLSDIVRGSWPYVLLIVVCAWILWLFPIIATYIPSTMGFAG
jgi:tripartite ATP-independent transporter DctM subunit